LTTWAQSYKHPEARLGFRRLRLKKTSTSMDKGLRLTVIFESYKHELNKEPKLLQRLVLNPISYLTLVPVA